VDLSIILGLSILVRALFITWMPAQAISYDLMHWGDAARYFSVEANPYSEPRLQWNWPPFWIPMLHVLYHLTDGLVPFFTAVRIFLIAIESTVAICLYFIVRRFFPQTIARQLLVIGVSLNPICVLLICQHGNFDVLASLFGILALAMLLSFRGGHDTLRWLWACAFLGLAILTKTVPWVLVPLLAIGARGLNTRALALGTLLLVGPTLYGLGVLYAVAPHEVVSQVLGYRSLPGWFGITGLMGLAGRSQWFSSYTAAFTILYCFTLVGVTFLCWRAREVSASREVLLSATLVSIPVFLGPGYAPQYFYWFLPFYLLVYAAFERGWRLLLGCAGAVATATYLIEYAFIPSHGQFLVHLFPTERMRQLSERLSSTSGATLLRLPLFATALIVLSVALVTLKQSPPRAAPDLAIHTSDARGL